jgi:hypothetical protein
MKNIHVLPTDKPSRLYLNTQEYIFENEYSLSTDECQNKNIYITSYEEIKEGDWIYNIVSKNIFKASKQLIDLINDPNVTLTTNKKIILTTDQELIKDGVQAIDDEFLEWFVNNPTCKRVEVESMVNMIQFTPREFIYKIIIPKEEAKPIHQQIIDAVGGKEAFMELAGLKYKQKTPEEAADKWVFETNGHKWSNNNNEAGDNFGSFIAGFKEAEKTLYSGEEVIKLLIYCKNRFGGSGLEDYTSDSEVIEWFEQIKNK